MLKKVLVIIWLTGAFRLFELVDHNAQAYRVVGFLLPILMIGVGALFWINDSLRFPQGVRQVVSALIFTLTIPMGTAAIVLFRVLTFPRGPERFLDALPSMFFPSVGILALAIILGISLKGWIFKSHEKRQGKKFQKLPDDLKE